MIILFSRNTGENLSPHLSIAEIFGSNITPLKKFFWASQEGFKIRVLHPLFSCHLHSQLALDAKREPVIRLALWHVVCFSYVYESWTVQRTLNLVLFSQGVRVNSATLTGDLDPTILRCESLQGGED
jgi:hypothetical protein